MSTEAHSTTTRFGASGQTIGARVTGVVGAVTAWLIATVRLALGLVALVLGLVALRNGQVGRQATAEVVLGALAVVMAVINMVIAYNLLT